MYLNVELFAKLVTTDFTKIGNTIKDDNHNKAQRPAIKQLSQIKDNLIKPSDKDRNVVIWPVKMYEKET